LRLPRAEEDDGQSSLKSPRVLLRV